VRIKAISPWRWVSDAIEFRRLRRRLPNVHRGWSRASGKHQPETKAEYLERLRAIARERGLRRQRLKERPNTIGSPTSVHRPKCSRTEPARAVEVPPYA
jgi:hypothetical protein